MKTVSYTLPEHWASALINGDDTGLDDRETKALDFFVEYMVEKHGACRCLDVSGESDFKKYHDAREYGVLACTVSEFTFEIGE
jgi:hypothetical protein